MCRPIITCHRPGSISPARYPGVAASAAITNDSLAPPDQPRDPDGPRHPRSSTDPARSYSSSTRNAAVPGATSTGRYCHGEAKQSSSVQVPVCTVSSPMVPVCGQKTGDFTMPRRYSFELRAPNRSRGSAMPGDAGDVGEDPVIRAERAHLILSREYLRLMRENVLAINPMAADRVSLEYLKADLYRRAESLKDLPDAPLFFGRLDYREEPWDGSPGSEPAGGSGGSPPRASTAHRPAARA